MHLFSNYLRKWECKTETTGCIKIHKWWTNVWHYIHSEISGSVRGRVVLSCYGSEKYAWILKRSCATALGSSAQTIHNGLPLNAVAQGWAFPQPLTRIVDSRVGDMQKRRNWVPKRYTTMWHWIRFTFSQWVRLSFLQLLLQTWRLHNLETLMDFRKVLCKYRICGSIRDIMSNKVMYAGGGGLCSQKSKRRAQMIFNQLPSNCPQILNVGGSEKWW